MTCDTCNCFSFWANFCPFAPIAAKKIRISKKKKKEKKKKPADIMILKMYQKLQLDDVRFLRHGAQWTDGRTEKVTCRGGCPT